AKRLANALKHVEAVIKLCDPDYNVNAIALRRKNRTNPWFKRGHLFRAILDVLKAATEPLPVPQIARRLVAKRGDVSPKPADMRRLNDSVREVLFRGGLARHVIAEAGKPARWRLISGGQSDTI